METVSLRHRVARHATEALFGGRTPAQKRLEHVPAKGVFRVLICRVTHSLGNTLLLTPLVREIETTYPGAEIDILSRSQAAEDIFGERMSVRTIYQLPAHAFRHPFRFLGALRRMRSVHYDLAIDPCPRSRTGRSLLLLARSRFKIGFANSSKNGSITHPITLPSAPTHAGQLPVALLRAALGHSERRPYPTLDVCISEAERKQGVEILKQLTRRLPEAIRKNGAIGIFANATGPKLLDGDWWQRFLTVLEAHKKGFAFVEIVPMAGRSLLGSRYPAYYSSSIGRLSSVLSGLSLFISADCGVMHLACASGAPTLGIFNATDPAEWGPYGPNDRVIDIRGLTPEQAALRAVS